MCVDLIYQSNVKIFLNIDRPVKNPINMIESRQNTDFRTVFRISIGCFNSLFFVPNFQPKFWEGDQIYLTEILLNFSTY